MGETVANIEWTEALMTGNTLIDDQHKILVNMLNEANERIDDKTPREVIQEVVKDLISYALYHFDEEEELMISAGYPDIRSEQHIREHRLFSEKVESVHHGLVQGKMVQRDDLLDYLNQWLVNHIMGTDMQLGAFLKGSAAA